MRIESKIWELQNSIEFLTITPINSSTACVFKLLALEIFKVGFKEKIFFTILKWFKSKSLNFVWLSVDLLDTNKASNSLTLTISFRVFKAFKNLGRKKWVNTI